MVPEKFRIRDDAKWGHPELEMAYSLMGQSVGYSEVLLNDDLSFEERQEFAAHAEDGFKDYLPDYDWTRVTEYEAKGCIDEPDAPAVKLLVANPREGKWRYKKNSPCIMIIPGGGLTTCFRFTAAIEDWADKYGVPVATFNYRVLTQGAKYPEPVNDCEAAYNYLAEHAKELNISANKIVIHGNSSGGHLSLALCHRLKKRGITPRGCLVWVPIIDDRPLPQYRSLSINSAFRAAALSCFFPGVRLPHSHLFAALCKSDFPATAALHSLVETCVSVELRLSYHLFRRLSSKKHWENNCRTQKRG